MAMLAYEKLPWPLVCLSVYFQLLPKIENGNFFPNFDKVEQRVRLGFGRLNYVIIAVISVAIYQNTNLNHNNTVL